MTTPRHASRLAASLLALVLVALVLLPACGDEERTVAAPEPFRVTIKVTDPGGAPVSGLALGLVPDSPWYQDGKRGGGTAAPAFERLSPPTPCPFYPFTVLRFNLDLERHVHLAIEDVAGQELRLLMDQTRPAGAHVVQWNGRDEADQPQPSGVYLARLVLRDADTGEVVLDASQAMLLAVFYADQYEVGVTDAEGRIVLEDRRLFPQLYDLPVITATDEDGNELGEVEIGPAMRFYLTDRDGGGTRRFDAEVNGSTTLRFTWEP